MEFGVFDHLDRGSAPLKEFYESRLKLIEAYDRAGFYAYHVAEHHSTPLGMAPSPTVFLSAVAQRTRRLRFGPLVYALPLHHPLRLVEEICMLDQLSGGRLDIGFGRGSSPIEIAFYGQDPKKAQNVYAEALEIILQGLASGKVDFEGEFFSFKNVPLAVEPLQKPHPPIWYGVLSVESAERAARRGLNIVSLDSARETRSFAVVAETNQEALGAARRAYAIWHRSFYHLYRLGGTAPAHPRPAEFDAMIERGQGIAGCPETVCEFLERELNESDASYLVGQFAFGDLSLAESLRSVELFTRHVMPRLKPFP